MIEPRPLGREAFAPFGDVIDASHPNRFEINEEVELETTVRWVRG